MISVIIPMSDRPGPLHRALRSVARQTYRDFEVIVVRDGGAPVDRVVTRWQTELPITLLDTGRPRGVAYARNLALVHASGENVAFLDDDDVFLPHHLAEAAAVDHIEGAMANVIAKDAKVTVLGTNGPETRPGDQHRQDPVRRGPGAQAVRQRAVEAEEHRVLRGPELLRRGRGPGQQDH